ncbi:CT20 family protein [Sphaerosporella brunnea]|uniref:CT20 family protein n=1 Tax=Sphaerosporella brunnea TaxID=1250544 RepID=A0A5J5EV72_9PEZI|nr:CT20 family protein [Sphaerosporella brunnea]
MPPKKKPRPAPRIATPPTQAPSTPAAALLGEPLSTLDSWTDEQETTLFKAISIYKLKPAGMHKHFRIIGIAELMKNHGVSTSHTNIAGIWEKLRTMYSLEGLDEREDDDPDEWTEFALPEEEFGELMKQRREDPDSKDSPVRQLVDISEDEDTVSDDSSRDSTPIPISTRGRGRGRGGRGGRGGGRGGRAVDRTKDAAEEVSSTSTSEDEEEEEEADGEEEDDDEEAEGEDDEDEEEGEGSDDTTDEDEGSPEPGITTRGRGRGRGGRGSRGGRGATRGRGRGGGRGRGRGRGAARAGPRRSSRKKE